MARSKRVTRSTTLLVVGEGADDKAFIDYMKQLFCPRNCGRTAKIEAGDGGSAGNVIENAIRSFKSIDYDRRILVLDSDLPPTIEQEKRPQRNGYCIILWSPQSLEGALLDVLGEKVGDYESSQKLKQRLHPRLAGKHTTPSAYRILFPLSVLEQTHNVSVSQVRATLKGGQTY